MPSVDEFMVKHDRLAAVREKLRIALGSMAHDQYEKELDICKMAGVSANDVVHLREHFYAHIVVTGRPSARRHLWVGNTDIAAKMRAVIADQKR